MLGKEREKRGHSLDQNKWHKVKQSHQLPVSLTLLDPPKILVRASPTYRQHQGPSTESTRSTKLTKGKEMRKGLDSSLMLLLSHLQMGFHL